MPLLVSCFRDSPKNKDMSVLRQMIAVKRLFNRCKGDGEDFISAGIAEG